MPKRLICSTHILTLTNHQVVLSIGFSPSIVAAFNTSTRTLEKVLSGVTSTDREFLHLGGTGMPRAIWQVATATNKSHHQWRRNRCLKSSKIRRSHFWRLTDSSKLKLTKPWNAIKDAGATVELVSINSDEIQGVNHDEKADKFSVDKNARASQCD